MPRQVSFPAGTGAIVDVGAGDDYVLAVDGSGAVFGWGQGMHFSHVLCTVASHMRRRIHACHMTRRIHAFLTRPLYRGFTY
jgi:alpha-tubulin suppressor-like RCC1 family protein